MQDLTKQFFKKITTPIERDELFSTLSKYYTKDIKCQTDLFRYYFALTRVYEKNILTEFQCLVYLSDCMYKILDFYFKHDPSRVQIQATYWDDASAERHKTKSAGTFAHIQLSNKVYFDISLHCQYLENTWDGADTNRIHKLIQLIDADRNTQSDNVSDWIGGRVRVNGSDHYCGTNTPIFLKYQDCVTVQKLLVPHIKQNETLYCFYHLNGGEII